MKLGFDCTLTVAGSITPPKAEDESQSGRPKATGSMSPNTA